jgi:hypothetical protein
MLIITFVLIFPWLLLAMLMALEQLENRLLPDVVVLDERELSAEPAPSLVRRPSAVPLPR